MTRTHINKPFTFTAETAQRLLQDLNDGRIVRLGKANGSAIILRDGIDLDEFGDKIYRMSIWPAKGHTLIHRVPMNEPDMLNFLDGEHFDSYDLKS